MTDGVWTLTALKEYLDRRFRDAETAVDKALAESRRASDKAEAAVDRRLEGMNEFRNQLSDERSLYLTAASYDQQHTALEEKVAAVDEKNGIRIGAVERWQAKIVGALALVVVLLPVLTAFILWLLTTK